jgi:hypothetical protein
MQNYQKMLMPVAFGIGRSISLRTLNDMERSSFPFTDQRNSPNSSPWQCDWDFSMKLQKIAFASRLNESFLAMQQMNLSYCLMTENGIRHDLDDIIDFDNIQHGFTTRNSRISKFDAKVFGFTGTFVRSCYRVSSVAHPKISWLSPD